MDYPTPFLTSTVSTHPKSSQYGGPLKIAGLEYFEIRTINDNQVIKFGDLKYMRLQQTFTGCYNINLNFSNLP